MQQPAASVFRIRSFRLMWAGNMLVHFSSWLFLVGAAWLMTRLTPDPLMVALVQSASALASLLLSLPAGAIADTVGRRGLMMALQLASCAACMAVAGSQAAGMLSAWLLLLLTFATQASLATYLPLANATMVDAVRPEQVEESMALAGVALNLARSAGPGLAGLGLLYVGAPVLYAVTAAAFALACVLLYQLPRERHECNGAPEALGTAMMAVFRYAREERAVQALLLRAATISFSGSALWALLPIVATGFDGASSSTFGTLVGSLGLGAVFGAFALVRLRRWAGPETVVNAASGVFALVTLAIALSASLSLAYVVLLVGGAAWMLSSTVLFAIGQSEVPEWVRARIYALLLVCFQAGFAAGAAVWGAAARHAGVRYALVLAAVSVLGTFAAARWLPLRSAPPS
ncbi:MAG TPA: MFS transporter [Ramlibacter sp.]|nr:MFS transporter [Ramlibacter sp.]